MKRAIILSLCLMLCGCVLQSHTAIFSESDGGPIPAALGTGLMMEEHGKAGWTKEEGTFTLQAEGKHYVASDGDKKSDVNALFVPLGNNWWVVAVAGVGDPNAYVLAEWTGSALLLRALDCAALKLQPSAAAAISFEGDDCYLKDKPGVDYFRQFTTGTTPATMRLTPMK